MSAATGSDGETTRCDSKAWRGRATGHAKRTSGSSQYFTPFALVLALWEAGEDSGARIDESYLSGRALAPPLSPSLAFMQRTR